MEAAGVTSQKNKGERILNNYIMYNGIKYDLDEPRFSSMVTELNKLSSNPFWTKNTIRNGDQWYDASDSYFEGGLYGEYRVEDGLLDEARLVKTARDAKIVYTRELLNRKLWSYKGEYDHPTVIESKEALWVLGVYLDCGRNLVCFAPRYTNGILLGCICFRSKSALNKAILEVVEPIMEEYRDDLDFCMRVVGLR